VVLGGTLVVAYPALLTAYPILQVPFHKTAQICNVTIPANNMKPPIHRDPHDRVPNTVNP